MSYLFFFFSSRRRHTRLQGDWSSDVCSSDLRRPATPKRWYFFFGYPRACGSNTPRNSGRGSFDHKGGGGHGEGEEGVRGLRDQLQGLHGHVGAGLRSHADRAVRDDQEALVLREAEEAREDVSGRRSTGSGGSLRRAALFFCAGPSSAEGGPRAELVEVADDDDGASP